MTCCDHCVDSETLFSDRTARRDLRRYRRKGLRPSTRLLVEGVLPDAPGATLLDIGGGVGGIQHELFNEGLDRAIQIDASEAYLEKSAEEARRRGHVDRVTYRYGDFVDIADEIPNADIVTLDRVICCYPDVDGLVTGSAAKAGRTYGLVFPRERWFTRIMLAMGNTYFRVRGSAFRTYLHSAKHVDELLRGMAFAPAFERETVMWRVVVYRREA